MCGKDFRTFLRISSLRGSPPHVRERPRRQGDAGRGYRITPACAGKTPSGFSVPGPCEDHPRMCGKDPFSSCIIFPQPGSPPHVRERPRGNNNGGNAPGITPACAGKTVVMVGRVGDDEDHPRMCGKDILTLMLPTKNRGSPPHVRERLG